MNVNNLKIGDIIITNVNEVFFVHSNYRVIKTFKEINPSLFSVS
jgi:hypothetical protein